MEQTIEWMRKRHAYYTSLIEEKGIATARQFYDELYDFFMLFGIELQYYPESDCCGLCIELEDYDYEQYVIETDKEKGRAVISPVIEYKDVYCAHTDVNIFEDNQL